MDGGDLPWRLLPHVSVRIRKRLLMQVSRAAVKSDRRHFWCSLKQKAPN
jgi:hypothetical protein